MHPATLRQLVRSERLPLEAVADFVARAARDRAAAMHAAVSNARARLPLLAHVHESLSAALGALSVPHGRSSHGTDIAAAEHLSASVTSLYKALQTGIDSHRPVFAQLRRDGRADVEGELSSLFDALQHNAIGLSVQASSLLARSRGAPPPVNHVALPAVVRRTLDDVRAFSVEKFGVAPPVAVHVTCSSVPTSACASAAAGTPAACDHETRFLGVPEFASFSASELLKNAFRAHIDRYGAGGVDDAPPISVRVSGSKMTVSLRVSDMGGGLPGGTHRLGGAVTRFAYFGSTYVPMEAGWTYSREHGAPFTGLGLGLVRAQLHAAFMGGGLVLTSQPGAGVDALVWFDRHGDSAVDFLPLPCG